MRAIVRDVSHDREPCVNGWCDRDEVSAHWVAPQEPCTCWLTYIWALTRKYNWTIRAWGRCYYFNNSLLSLPICLPIWRAICCAPVFCVFFYFNGALPLEIKHFRMYWTDLQQFFKSGRCWVQDGGDQYQAFGLRSLNGRCHGNQLIYGPNWRMRPSRPLVVTLALSTPMYGEEHVHLIGICWALCVTPLFIRPECVQQASISTRVSFNTVC